MIRRSLTCFFEYVFSEVKQNVSDVQRKRGARTLVI